jgi:chorismate dehydratase
MPIEELHGRTVGLTTSSQTSVVLLKMLLEKFYGITPVYVPVVPNPDMTGVDARLVIGNDAMVQCSEPVEYTYDLGDLWQRKTGHPVVFALVTVQNSFLSERKGDVLRVVDSFNSSLDVLENSPGELISGAQKKYSHISYDVEHYYSLLKFRFLQHHKDALAYYYSLAGEMGLLEKVETIGWAEL